MHFDIKTPGTTRQITRFLYHNKPDWSHIFTTEESALIRANRWVIGNAPRPIKTAWDIRDDNGRLLDCPTGPHFEGYPEHVDMHGIFWAAGPRDQMEDSWARDDATFILLTDDAELEAVIDNLLAADGASIDDYTDHGLGYPEAAAVYRLPYGRT